MDGTGRGKFPPPPDLRLNEPLPPGKYITVEVASKAVTIAMQDLYLVILLKYKIIKFQLGFMNR